MTFERQRVLSWLAPFAIVASGCGTEIGKASWDGAGMHEVSVTMPKAGDVQFRTSGKFLRPSNSSPYKGKWTFKIETVKNGVVASSRACDPLDVSFSVSGAETCGSNHTNCTERYANTKINGCAVSLPEGQTTVRMTLAPLNIVDARIQELDVVIVR